MAKAHAGFQDGYCIAAKNRHCLGIVADALEPDGSGTAAAVAGRLKGVFQRPSKHRLASLKGLEARLHRKSMRLGDHSLLLMRWCARVVVVVMDNQLRAWTGLMVQCLLSVC